MTILTGQTEDMAEDERECLRGRWIHGEGMRRFMALPGFRALDSCHHRMHGVSRVLSDRPLDSFRPGELREALQKTKDASQQLLSALDGLDEQGAAVSAWLCAAYLSAAHNVKS